MSSAHSPKVCPSGASFLFKFVVYKELSDYFIHQSQIVVNFRIFVVEDDTFFVYYLYLSR